MNARFTAAALAGMSVLVLVAAPHAVALTVGSKAFPESWILAEALALSARDAGLDPVEHRSNLGGTEIVYAALRDGSIDVYPEYTGTIAEVILKSQGRPALDAMRRDLASQGIGISAPLGFNDSYALAVRESLAVRLGLGRISDLAAHPELRFGLTHEFLGRADGWPGLAERYGFRFREVTGIQHELAYAAIAAGKIDVMDIYTTDAQIEPLELHVLEDDRAFFPRYDAVWLYRLDLADREPGAMDALRRWEGRIDEARMTRANARVVLRKVPFAVAADSLVRDTFGSARRGDARTPGVAGRIMRDTRRHLGLVLVSLSLAILAGVPLGVLATRSAPLAQLTLTAAGLLQTVPSLALLAFLIPFFGIGTRPALVALFLYGLLPIVRNTFVGLTTVPGPLAEVTEALGLSGPAKLFRIRLPMASPAIMAGIKTSAVINVGTATLAALIGAGGLGDPILSGIQLRRTDLILQGAIPAALLALLVQGAFDVAERFVVPRGLRLRPDRARSGTE